MFKLHFYSIIYTQLNVPKVKSVHLCVTTTKTTSIILKIFHLPPCSEETQVQPRKMSDLLSVIKDWFAHCRILCKWNHTVRSLFLSDF